MGAFPPFENLPFPSSLPQSWDPHQSPPLLLTPTLTAASLLLSDRRGPCVLPYFLLILTRGKHLIHADQGGDLAVIIKPRLLGLNFYNSRIFSSTRPPTLAFTPPPNRALRPLLHLAPCPYSSTLSPFFAIGQTSPLYRRGRKKRLPQQTQEFPSPRWFVPYPWTFLSFCFPNLHLGRATFQFPGRRSWLSPPFKPTRLTSPPSAF